MKCRNGASRQFLFAVGMSLLALAWQVSPAVLVAHELDVEALRAVEHRVQQVVEKNLGAVVAVTDGIGYGSGVVVSEDGLVLTAGHVLITGGTQYRVIFPNGRQVRATPLGRNLNHDAGMVKIAEPGPWPHAELGDASQLRLGDWCVCLGHSGGYELGRRPPVRAGRIIKFETDQFVTDCVLIGGDSGGPLFDLDGRVIGIHSSIGSSVAENRHVSIAIYRKYWDRLVRGERWGTLPELSEKKAQESRPSMGIRVDRKSDRAEIRHIHPGRPAEAAGLKVGDIVLRYDGVPVNSGAHLIDLIAGCRPGDVVDLVIFRNSVEIPLSVKLGDSR